MQTDKRTRFEVNGHSFGLDANDKATKILVTFHAGQIVSKSVCMKEVEDLCEAAANVIYLSSLQARVIMAGAIVRLTE